MKKTPVLRCRQGICSDTRLGPLAVALYPQSDGVNAWHYVPVCKFHADSDWWYDVDEPHLPTIPLPLAGGGA